MIRKLLRYLLSVHEKNSFAEVSKNKIQIWK